MARRSGKLYSDAQKSALIAEVERLYSAGGRTYVSIARELGINDTSYHNWLRQGIKPAQPTATLPVAPAAQRVFQPGERERLVAEVERLRGLGHSVVVACKMSGISGKSYRKWKTPTAALTMRPVEVTALVPTVAMALTMVPPKPAPATPALSLFAPGGYRIEGLDVETAARLLRALS